MNDAKTIGSNALVLDTAEENVTVMNAEESKLGKEVSLIEQRAEAVVVASGADFEDAGLFLKQIKQAQKQVKDYWEPLRVSAKKSYDEVLNHRKEMIEPLEKAEKIVKAKVNEYSAEQERKRREQEEAMRRLAQAEIDRHLNEAAEAEATMRWGSRPITSSTAIIWATRTRRTNRSPAVATPFARRWLRLLQGQTSPNTSPKWATPSRQWPPCWTWWRCRKEQDMDKKKLMELAERYQCKADTAFQNYQETGITRYDTARRNNEDMAEALRMAASAKEDHDRMIHLRGVLSQLAWRAAEANRASEEDRPRKMQAVLGELLSAARMQGLIRDEGGDFK